MAQSWSQTEQTKNCTQFQVPPSMGERKQPLHMGRGETITINAMRILTAQICPFMRSEVVAMSSQHR